VRRSSIRWLIDCLLACAVATGSPSAAILLAQPAPGPQPAAPRASPQPAPSDTIRCTRNVAGDSKPVVVTADEIAAWQEGGDTFVFMRGQVLLQQSVIVLRCDYGVARINADRYRRTGIWHLDIYAEGNVKLDSSVDLKEAPKAVIELNTRGEIKLTSQRGKVARRPMADDPLVTRGRAEWPKDVPVVQSPPGMRPTLRRISLEEPVAPPAPFVPGAISPPQGGPTIGAPVAPPPETPVPVSPPKNSPVPHGALTPSPGIVTRIACYQPAAGCSSSACKSDASGSKAERDQHRAAIGTETQPSIP